MNADERRYEHSDLTQRVIGAFYEVYNELGHGFLESVYEAAMSRSLRDAQITAVRQHPVQVFFRGDLVGDFRSDLIVEGTVLVELKSARSLDSSHEAQVLNYLRATRLEVGLLLNFGVKPEVRRFAYSNNRKSSMPSS